MSYYEKLQQCVDSIVYKAINNQLPVSCAISIKESFEKYKETKTIEEASKIKGGRNV